MKKRWNNSAQQKYTTQAKPLITFGSGSGTATVSFKVPCPDSRCRVKISVLFIPVAGANPITGITNAATLWLRETEDENSGVSGTTIPCTNIEGTGTAPTAFPAQGLYGYSREFATAADNIEGTLVVNATGPMIGTWTLQCRIQPIGVRFTDEEWDDIVGQFNPQLSTQPQNVP